MQMPRRHQARNTLLRAGAAGLLVQGWKPLTCVRPAAISPGSCTQAHTSAENTRQRLLHQPVWPMALRLPLAEVVFKLDNCFTRLPCGLLWGPVTGKRIFHPGRSRPDHYHQ